MIMSYQRIATEEAFATTEQLRLYRRMLGDGSIHDPGFLSLWGFYLQSPSERATQIIERLQNIASRRIADMDATGISMQILSLTSPGVQVFDAATAVSFARDSNDQLAAAIAKYPTRLAGLAAVAPQNPREAASELERGVRTLGLTRGGPPGRGAALLALQARLHASRHGCFQALPLHETTAKAGE
jgi:5-carboxyvanillate decarboxylase